jgi:hypothetical protein
LKSPGKKVRIHDPSPHRRNHSFSPSPGIDKEAIEPPNARPRPPNRAERCIGAIMAGSSGSIHGLTGKALLYDFFLYSPSWLRLHNESTNILTFSLGNRYFTSIFVSLGVFLFGYDQGVMSGIITYVFDV